jgi:26S proteasome non-ATPase regulatory subunit 10
MLIESSTPSVKLRLNTADRVGENIHRRPVNPYSRKLISVHPRLRNSGNTPLHLAMDSAHAEAAVVLINAGADRTRVRFIQICGILQVAA